MMFQNSKVLKFAGVFLILIVAGYVISQNSVVRSHFWLAKREAASKKIIQKETEELAERKIRGKPETKFLSEAELTKRDLVPEPLKAFAKSIRQPTLRRVQFEDKTEGLLLEESRHTNPTCPILNAARVADFNLAFYQKMPHVHRSVYRSRTHEIFAESHALEFSCDVAIYLKPTSLVTSRIAR